MPYASKEAAKAWRDNNKEQRAAYRKEYYAKNKAKENARYKPDAMRARHLQQTYGITIEDWDALFLSQGSACAICRATDPGTKLGWHVDHCHNTQAVRGILCGGCNTGLGHFRDNKDALRSAVEYLEKHERRDVL
jgi:hypothetical protein